MSNYTKTTDFAAKDSLPTGDAGKIIRGAEFGTEFDNIATAIATKADTAGPTLTGTTTFDTLSDGTIAVTAFVDEDDMSSDSATMLPTQQSVKAYVDSQATAQDLDFEADTGGPLSIDLDSETMTFTGGVGIDTTGSGNDVSFAIDSTVTTLTGTQTLTNKTLTTPTISGNLTTDGTIDGRDIATDGTKLDTVETNADVTDTTNVTAAGALMDSEVTNLDQVKAFDSADYATAAQGTTADNALPKTGGAMTGAITTNSTFDGRNVATDGAKLDGIEALADVTDTTNVTAAGALMDSELTDLTAVKSLDQGVATTDTPTFAGLATSADVTFGDNDKAIFGAGSDLQIYHDGSNSRIQDAGSGNLKLVTDGAAIQLQSATENMIVATPDADVQLYYNGVQKLATTATGIDVTGTVTADGLTVDGNIQGDAGQNMQVSAGAGTGDKLDLRAGDDVRIYVDGATAHKLAANFANNGDVSLYEDTGTSPKFFWDASAESLGIGTTPDTATVLHVQATEPQVLISDTSNPLQRFMAFDVGLAADEDTQFITVDQADALAFGEKLNGNDRVIENEWMRITNAGNVGIGITPSKKLTVFGTGAGNATVQIEGEGGADPYINFLTNNVQHWSLGVDDSDADKFKLSEHSALGTNDYLTVDVTGNVGIGTSSPSSSYGTNLHVHSTATSSAIKLTNSSTSTGSSDGFELFGSGVNTYLLNREAGFMYFGTSNTEAMRIDSSQNLLVGTTNVNPAANNVTGHSLKAGGLVEHANSGAMVMRLNRTDSDGSIIEFRKGTDVVGEVGTRANYIKIGNGDTQLLFNSASDAITPEGSTDNRDAAIDLGRDVVSRFKDLYLSGNVKHGVTPSSSAAGVFTEAVGRTTYSRGSATGGFAHLTFINGNGSVGSVVTSGSATAYNTSSDYRLKENAVALTGATDRLNQLSPKRFNFIADAETTVDGFMAHEVQSVVPEAITGTHNEVDDEGNPVYQAIDQSKLVPLLVATIQELEARITALETN